MVALQTIHSSVSRSSGISRKWGSECFTCLCNRIMFHLVALPLILCCSETSRSSCHSASFRNPLVPCNLCSNCLHPLLQRYLLRNLNTPTVYSLSLHVAKFLSWNLAGDEREVLARHASSDNAVTGKSRRANGTTSGERNDRCKHVSSTLSL